MKAFALLNHMIRRSGKNRQELSASMNRSDSYLRTTVSNKTVPTVDMFSKIAKVCGYEVHVIGHDEDITVDPKEP